MRYLFQTQKINFPIEFYQTGKLQAWILTCSRKLPTISLSSDDVDFDSDYIALDKDHIYLVISNNSLEYYYKSSDSADDRIEKGIIKQEKLKIDIHTKTTLEDLKPYYLSIIDEVNKSSEINFPISKNSLSPYQTMKLPMIWTENNSQILEGLLGCSNFINSMLALPNSSLRVSQFLENAVARNFDTIVKRILTHPCVGIDNRILYGMLRNPDYSYACKKLIAEKLSSQNIHNFGLFQNNLKSTKDLPQELVPIITHYYFQLP